jgi:hypothetical protein
MGEPASCATAQAGVTLAPADEAEPQRENGDGGVSRLVSSGSSSAGATTTVPAAGCVKVESIRVDAPSSGSGPATLAQPEHTYERGRRGSRVYVVGFLPRAVAPQRDWSSPPSQFRVSIALPSPLYAGWPLKSGSPFHGVHDHALPTRIA